MAVTVPWTGTYNGLGFGPGTIVQWNNLDGLRGIPPLRSGDISKARQDGDNAGLDFMSSRVFSIDFTIFNPSIAFETVMAQVALACQPISDPSQQLPFEMLLPGWATSRIITCRPTQAGAPIDAKFQYNATTVPIQFTANDPLIYSSTLKQAGPVGLPSPTAGLTFNVTFNATFGASTGGSMSVTNSGNYLTAPVFTITGPMTNPSITFTSTGQFISFNLALSAGDVLVVDTGNRLVTLNGTAARFNAVVTGSSWWGIPAGTWSIGVSSSDSATVAGTFAAAYRDAWGFM